MAPKNQDMVMAEPPDSHPRKHVQWEPNGEPSDGRESSSKYIRYKERAAAAYYARAIRPRKR